MAITLRDVGVMDERTDICEKGVSPDTCGPEQVRECHGEGARHICASAHPEGSRPDSRPRRPTLPRLFWDFLRLGFTAFGGPAMVAYIGEMAVSRKQWLTRQSFREGVSVAQAIPGATAMQVAAYVGLRLRGISGAAAAYLGFGLPAFAFMIGLSIAYAATSKLPVSTATFLGLQVMVVAIVARATISFGRTTVKGWKDALLGVAAAVALVRGGHPVVVIAGGAVLGVVLYRGVLSRGTEELDESPPLPPTIRPALLIGLGALIGLIVLLFVDPRLFDLCLVMLRVDALAFGGGFASVPLMLHEVVGVRHWMTTRAFMDGIAMGQVTPGPIVITATFVGYRVAGIAGAMLATISIFLPSFLILVAVVPHFDRVKANPYFERGMRGILASFVGLLAAVTIKFALAVPWSPLSALVAVAAFTALMLKVPVPWVVVPGAALSALLFR